MADLTTIILTYNEELNIEKCIQSVNHISKRIIVIDSFSEDNTVEIAKSLGAEIIQNKFINHAKQFQFAIDNAQITSKWIFRIDADERLTSESSSEMDKICNEFQNNNEITGIIVRFEVNFLGKKLKHGGIYPFKKLLVYKNGIGKMEQRNMDEHIYLTSGKAVHMQMDSIHDDYKNLSAWIDKHNNYSNKEVLDYFKAEQQEVILSGKSKYKRWVKNNIYYKMPLGSRSLIYFIYRYFFKLGFLDGKEGLIFAVLQAFWYRFLVDAKILEYEKRNKNE